MWKKITAGILILVVTLTTAIYFFQDKLIFRPIALERTHTFHFTQKFEEHFVPTPDGEELNVIWFKPGTPSKGLVLYFHGNAGNLDRWGTYADDLVKLGYEVVMMDYRSYGKSTGKPSEQKFYEDSETICHWALKRSQPEKLIIFGRSLGTPVATRLASIVQPPLLILETPFDELEGAIPVLLKPVYTLYPAKNIFPTKEFIKSVKGKIIIFHGTNDKIVPIESAKGLIPFLKPGDEFIILQDGNHRNLSTYTEYQKKLTMALQ